MPMETAVRNAEKTRIAITMAVQSRSVPYNEKFKQKEIKEQSS